MENHISLYKHENTWNNCGGVLNSEVAMSGVGEQAFTLKKKCKPHDIMLANWGICSIFYIFDSSKKTILEKVWSLEG
jgi:hypothetical protein